MKGVTSSEGAKWQRGRENLRFPADTALAEQDSLAPSGDCKKSWLLWWTQILFYWAFKHAPLLRVPLCVSWAFLVQYNQTPKRSKLHQSLLPHDIYTLSCPPKNCHCQMNIDELKTRLVNEWAQFDQSIIDAAISQWRRRLSACVRARGAHFEHKFWQFWTQVL